LTEAAEVLLDHGQTNVYSWTKEQAQQQLHHLDKQQQQQPASNAPKLVSRSCCYDEQTVSCQTCRLCLAGLEAYHCAALFLMHHSLCYTGM